MLNHIARRLSPTLLALVVTLLAWPCLAQADAGEVVEDEGWISLFNGENLDGWTPKIKGHEFGENHLDTFRVEDGVIKVRYDGYDQFDGAFGHLFYKEPFSSYRLRLEYRFVGEQCSGGPGWAFRNSGVMLHSQAPETMGQYQDFPVSIEVQLLGGDGTNERHTANVCSPGTNYERDGQLVTQHCADSTSETYHGDEWVTVEIEVHGNGTIRHWIEGEVVFEYERPQLDPNDGDAKPLIAEHGGELMLSEGYICLQAESHPCEFRRVEILPLEE